MNRQEIFELVQKYNRGECSQEEVTLLETWYLNESELYHTELPESKIDTDLKEVYRQLPKPGKRYVFWSRIYQLKTSTWTVAASIILVLGAGFYFSRDVILSLSKDSNVLLGLSKHDIAPGTNKATLTLANGRVINLSGAKAGVVIDASKVTYSDGTEVLGEVRVSSRTEPLGPQSGQSLRGSSGDPLTSANKQLIASTPRGGTYQVILPDGTHVFLNAASSIKFPATFAGLKERKVELTGEAYFIVKHDAKQPFRVQTAGQIVEDIGTEFNINSYTDEPAIRTTLIEGSARVVSRNPTVTLNLSKGIILKPNQQSVLTSGNIIVKNVNAAEAILWKDGKFSFNHEELTSIMRKVSRWYNVDVVYDANVKGVTMTGSVSRFANLSTLLTKLEQTGGIKFKIEQQKITVTK